MSNIFVDCYVFEGEYQGTRTFIKEIYNKIFLIESSNDNNIQNNYFLVSNDIIQLETEFQGYDFVKLIKCKFKNRFIRLLFEYPYIIFKYKIDIAHFQYVVPPFKLCKYVVTIHDILFCDHYQYFSIKYRIKNFLTFFLSYTLSDCITTVSEHSKNSIIKNFLIKKNIIITPNGVNELYFNYKTNIVKDEFLINQNCRDYFLYVSRFEPRKNHISLLQAFVNGSYFNDYDLVFIGSKTLSCPEFNQYYNNLDDRIINKIKFLNEGVNNDLLLLYYKYCTIFIYPSLLEGFGIPPLEASAMGSPVICSNQTAMSDFIFYNENLIFPNPNNIQDSIKSILSNNFRHTNEIKLQIRQKYNWSKSATELLKGFATLQ